MRQYLRKVIWIKVRDAEKVENMWLFQKLKKKMVKENIKKQKKNKWNAKANVFG